jgi:hypothetical protein
VNTIQVTDMPRASLVEDGSLVQMEFKTDGEPITLEFDPDKLEQWAARTLELIRTAQTHKRASGGHFEVQASEVVAVEIAPAVGGGKVILGITGTNGIPQRFAFPLRAIDPLRTDLKRAAIKAFRQGSQTRQ